MSRLGPQWICEPEDAASESWMSDAPWEEASSRHSHEFLVRSKSGVARSMFAMEFIKLGDLARQVWLGNPIVCPGEIYGFYVLYKTRDPGQAQNANCIYSADGKPDGDLTSAWLIGWGPNTIYMATPDGQPPTNLCEIALIVADWRYAIRIANIPKNISKDDLQAWLAIASLKLPRGFEKNSLRPVFYLNADLRTCLGEDRYRDILVRETPFSFSEPYLP